MELKLTIPDKETKEIREAVDGIAKNEIDKMNAVCWWLIEQMRKTNATKMKIEQKGIHRHGEMLGDFNIEVEKTKPKE